MNCDGVSGLLSAYVDGELSAGELLRVEQHLRRCHWCADEVDALRQTISLVASLEEVEVPAAFHIHLHERLVALGPPVQALRTASARRAGRQDFRRWAVPAAAAAALVIGVAGLKSISPPTPVQTPPAYSANPTTPAGNPENVSNGGQVATVTDPNPEGEEPIVETPPGPDTSGASEAHADSTTPPETTGSGNPEPAGTSDTGATPSGRASTASASFLDNVSEPSTTAQKQLGASLEAAVLEPAAIADELKSRFAANAVSEKRDPASGMITLQITIEAAAFDSALASVAEQTGLSATTFAYDLSAQMAASYNAIYQLDLERERIENSLQGVTDTTAIALANQRLAELAAEAKQAQAAYQKLVDQSASGIIEVTLKPKPAR